MERRHLVRASLIWGGLAVVVQLWVGLIFVRGLADFWKEMRPQLVSFAESANRFSQLKTPALKYPWAGVYFALGAAGIVAMIGWLMIRGLREAIAPEREMNEPDEST